MSGSQRQRWRRQTHRPGRRPRRRRRAHRPDPAATLATSSSSSGSQPATLATSSSIRLRRGGYAGDFERIGWLAAVTLATSISRRTPPPEWHLTVGAQQYVRGANSRRLLRSSAIIGGRLPRRF